MKVIISGYGKMGHMVEEVLLAAGIEPVCATEDVCSVPEDIAKQCVCIDFTTPDAFRANYKTLAVRFKAVVVGTTGWYDIKDEVYQAFRQAGSVLVWASNFSIGVNAFFAAVRETLDGDVPIEAKRIGEVPGIHTARFVSEVDKLEFTHEAFSRKGFAEGAVTAAIMADGLEPGVYEFKDLIL